MSQPRSTITEEKWIASLDRTKKTAPLYDEAGNVKGTLTFSEYTVAMAAARLKRGYLQKEQLKQIGQSEE